MERSSTRYTFYRVKSYELVTWGFLYIMQVCVRFLLLTSFPIPQLVPVNTGQSKIPDVTAVFSSADVT